MGRTPLKVELEMLKKIKHKYGLLLLMAILLAQPTWLGANNLTDNPSYVTINNSKLSRDSILIGDQVTWSTNLTVKGDNSLAAVPYADLVAADSSKIEVLRGVELDTIAIKEGIAELEAKLLFSYFDSGYFKLPDAKFISSNGDTITLAAPSIAVNTIQIDTATFKMYDIKGQINYPITFKEVYPWVLFVLAVVLIGYLLYRFIKNKRENGSLFGKPVVKDPPHIVALRELDKLRTQKLWKESGKEKLVYTGVTDALREYIEGRYSISAMEKTSAEILKDLSDKKIEARPYNELNELFQLADLVKFAKYTPQEAESEEVIPMAVRFVNSTFLQEMEQEVSSGQSKAVEKESEEVVVKESSRIVTSDTVKQQVEESNNKEE